jgi:hypothetical protein
MSLDLELDPKPTFWQRAWRVVWGLRFLYVVIAILGGTVWLLYPLRDVSQIPAPPLPSYTPEPPDLQETLVLGPTTFAPGTQGATRVLVRDPRTGQPIPDVALRVSLAPRGQPDAGQTLYTGCSDEWGTAEVTFLVPHDAQGEQDLVVDADGPIGAQRVVRPLTIYQDTDLYLMTDKQVYRPGETIRFWWLALGRIDGLPLVGEPVTPTLSNTRGNRVCTQTATTSAYGVAHASCALADRVSYGTYRLEAALGEAVAEREVAVEPQAQADLAVQIQAGRSYYLSGERFDAVVLVADVFGEPVAGAMVDVLGEVDGMEAVAFRAQGQTDEQGAFAVAADLNLSPLDDLENGRVLLRVAARVFDEAGRVGQHQTWVPVSAQPMQITAWPESGALEPGIENLVYLQVVYPDGQPVACDLEITPTGVEGPLQAETDAAGLARVGYTPAAGQPVTMAVLARDAGGQAAQVVVELPVERGGRHLLLRPDRESYSAGGPMHVDVFVPGASEAVYLDLLLDGQEIATYAAPADDGHAAFDVTLPGKLAGAFELHAYVLLADGTVIRDARQVVVAPLRPMTLSAIPEQGRYETGDRARVVFRVVEESGQSVQGTFAAIVAVGESFLSSHQSRPDTGRVARDPVSAAELSPQYAEVASRRRPMPEPVRRELNAYEAAWAVRHQAFSTVAERLVWGALGWAALSWVVVLADGWRRRTPGRSGRALGTLLGGAVVLPFVVVGGALLAHFSRALLGTGAILALGIGWLGALSALLVQGWTHRSGWLHLCAALTIGALTLGGGLRFALLCGAAPASPLVVAGLAALGAALLALCVWAVGMLRRAEQGCALTTLSVAVLLVCTAAGSVLAGPDEGLPVYERLPEQAQVDTVPAPAFIQPDPPLLIPLPAADAFPQVPGQWLGRTVYWDAEARTDARGNLALDLPLGDSPIDLRLSALALTDKGTGCAGEAQVESYAPLSIELALPGELSVGDRLDVPVYIRNALPVSQVVQISVTQASWYRLRTWGMDVQETEVPAHGMAELTLPIQVREWGDAALQLHFEGDVRSGVVSRTISVQPNGHLIARAYSWWIGDWVRYKLRVPWSALRDTDQIAVKLYPGRWSVLAEALEQAVQWEGNSFDQVSAAVQARLLQAAYLRRIGRWEGARRAELERTLAFDYQRLLAFEAPDGGFSAFGTEEADLYRSALALRCLHELSAYCPVDPALLDRTALWLFRQQTEDGMWQLAEMPPSWSTLPRTELPATAYVAWALVDAGYGHMDDVRSAIEHLGRYVDQSGDPYVLALVVNALVAYGSETGALDAALVRLADQAEAQERLVFWPSRLQTLSGAAGGSLEADGYRTPSVKVETVALATYALSRARVYPERVDQGIAMLSDSRDVNGTWNAPQTTILALRAYVAALPKDEMPEEAAFAASVEVTVGEVAADPAVFVGDVGQTLVFDELAKGYNDVEIAVDGDEIGYQIVGRYVLPWSQVPPPLPEEEDVSVEVGYDRTSIGVGEQLTATVGVALNRPGIAPLVELGLGLPPGLSLALGDLDDLQAQGTIANYERVGGQIIVYLTNLSSEEPVGFSYRLRAMYPLAVLTQSTYAVDIANPQRPAVRPPVEIEVVTSR